MQNENNNNNNNEKNRCTTIYKDAIEQAEVVSRARKADDVAHLVNRRTEFWMHQELQHLIQIISRRTLCAEQKCV